MDPLIAHQRAQDAFASVLSKLRPEQLDAPTPCTDWTSRELVAHVVGGNCRMAGKDVPTPDDLGGWIEAHAASARAAQEAFAAPDGLTRMIEMPFGTVPGSVVLGLRITDVLTHAWDLARAAGLSTDLDPELAEETLALARQRVSPEFRGPGRPFADEQPCDSSRPAADRLAAFLGRSVD
jgi:uncharacterized protein (TIGR03086 family)